MPALGHMVVLILLAASVLVQLLAAGLALRMLRASSRPIVPASLAVALLVLSADQVFRLFQVLDGGGASPGPTAATLELIGSAALVTALLLVPASLRRRDHLAALSTERERFRELVEHTKDWIWEVDQEPVFTYCSPRCCEILGYAPDELVGRHPHDLMPEWEQERAGRALTRIMEAREPMVRLENVNLAKDGREVVLETSAIPIVDDDGTFRGYRGIDRDVTDRKREEEAKRRADRAMRVLAGGTEVLIQAEEEARLLEDVCRVVVEDGGYRFAWVGVPQLDAAHTVEPKASWGEAGDYLERIRVTWDASELGMGPTGRAIRDRQPAVARRIDAEPTFGPWRERAKDVGFASSAALPLVRGAQCFGALNVYADDPEAFDEEEIALLQRLAANMAYGISALRAEAHHKALDEILRHKQHMDTLGQLTGGIAHDFNNLLTVISANASLIIEMDLPDPEIARSLDDLAAAASSGAELVRKLLIFSKGGQLAREEVELRSTVQRHVAILERVLPEDISLSCHVGDEPLLAMVDPGAVEQIVVNLATNARDAIAGAGQMTITLERRDVSAEEPGFHGPVQAGAYACLEVADTGCGLSDDARRRLFDPFYTTKDRRRGTGLGLAVVYGLVLSHDGFLQVASTEGEGTAIRVFLPLTDTLEEELGLPE